MDNDPIPYNKNSPPYGVTLPPPLPWRDRKGVFKLGLPGEEARNTVICQNCKAQFLLKDYLDGELNENECPVCKAITGD